MTISPSAGSSRFTIIIPTKNRVEVLPQLLKSIAELQDLERIRPDVIVVDNNCIDDTPACVRSIAETFPVRIGIVRVTRGGKSAAINDAVKTVTGEILAFLDDDVVVDKTWLKAMEEFFRPGKYRVGQGLVQLQSPARDDPEIIRLVQRYRTIPRLEHDAGTETLHSLNGANVFMHRDAFIRVGGFDERLGPGASGTSEDVDLARRLALAGFAIGYAPQAVAFHRVDRDRLTEDYFKQIHWLQGGSRLLLRKRTTAGIFFDLVRAVGQFALFSLIGSERDRYRSKGRIYHYLGMMQAKRGRTR